jgi:hypothetical protein
MLKHINVNVKLEKLRESVTIITASASLTYSKKKELLLSLTGRLRETHNREEIKARGFVSRVNISTRSQRDVVYLG